MVRRRMRRALALVAGLTLALGAGCGGDDDRGGPAIGARGGEARAGEALGFPTFATKNTTRVGGADSIANAAGVAQAVYSGRSTVTRPAAVTLVDKDDWRGAVAAALLMSAPLRAPVLLSDGDDLPQGTEDALKALSPRGARQIGGAQVIRIGDVPRPEGFETVDVKGDDPFVLAQAIDRFQAAATQRTTERVVVAPADAPAFAMPAAGWAAKGGDPVLYVQRDSIPAPTRAALVSHQQPRIYVLGPPSVIGEDVEKELRKLGTVTRIQGANPVANSIAFARFIDGPFGWGVVDPGHGLVFLDAEQPVDAGVAAPLSASGMYGPQLVVDDGKSVPRALQQYLLDIQPGYQSDPVRGVYNHAWLIGDESALSVDLQSQLDALLEIVPVEESG